jgi:hypothetical protein
MGWTWHKYKAQRIKTRDGHSFASKLEGSLYEQLLLRVKAGELKNLKCQVQVRLTDAAIILKPDFSAEDAKTGQTIYIEAKGYETPEWRIKVRLWEYYGPGPLEIWKGSHKYPKYDKTVFPKTAK